MTDLKNKIFWEPKGDYPEKVYSTHVVYKKNNRYFYDEEKRRDWGDDNYYVETTEVYPNKNDVWAICIKRMTEHNKIKLKVIREYRTRILKAAKADGYKSK